ncbi:hypothetical protein N644_1864 [Lactiplantibacillus paraplantarum]|nr:hypothetical protein N644_1864 [Lactiplantibacillus paraplantarum]
MIWCNSKVDSKVWYKEDRAYLPSVASKSARMTVSVIGWTFFV